MMDSDLNDTTSSPPLMDETTTKRQRLTISTGTLSSPLPSLSPGDSLPAVPLPTLPFDLVAEILCRLPVKFLLQLQCVCKSWKSLISDTKFTKKHLRVSTTHHHLILTFFPNPLRELTIVDYPISSIFTTVTSAATQLQYPRNNQSRCNLLVGSCDGILCFAIDNNLALLWNPSIRKFNILPELEYRPEEGRTIYGFGLDHFTDEYKVVAVFCYKCTSAGNGVYKTQVHVHTLGTNIWRRIQDFPYGRPCISGKFVNGTVNWMAYTESSLPEVIVSFDLGKECYQEVLQPDYGGMDLVDLKLYVLRDCLCILSHRDTVFDIWVMKEYGNKESWTKLFTVPRVDSGVLPHTRAHYVSEDDQVLLQFQSELIVYNSRDGTFKTIEIENINGQNIYGCMVPNVYVESLISPCTWF